MKENTENSKEPVIGQTDYRKILISDLIHKSKIYGGLEGAAIATNSKMDGKKTEELVNVIEEYKEYLLYNLTNIFYNFEENRFGLISRYCKEGIYFGNELIEYNKIQVLTTKQYEVLDTLSNKYGMVVWVEPDMYKLKEIFASDMNTILRISLHNKKSDDTNN